jgi:hypothetical protein
VALIGDTGRPERTALPALPPPGAAAAATTLDVPVRGAPAGVDLRATAYAPRIALVGAVEVRIVEGSRRVRAVLGPRPPARRRLDAGRYTVTARPGLSFGELHRLAAAPAPATAPGRLRDEIALHAPGPYPAAVVRRRGGGRDIVLLEPGEPAELKLTATTVSLTLVRSVLLAADESDGGAVTAAVKVRAVAGGRSVEAHVPYSPFQRQAEPVVLRLPSGRRLRLSLLRQTRPLPATVTVRRAELQTYPASVVTKDYVADLTIARGGRKRRATLRLNHPVRVGPYRLSHGRWLPPEQPEMIAFGVGTRPALPVIWAGCALIVLGIPYAFYVKPLLLRRRRARP